MRNIFYLTRTQTQVPKGKWYGPCCKDEEEKEEEKEKAPPNLLKFTEMNAWEDGLRVRRRVRKSPQQNLAGPYATYNDDDSEEDKDELEFSTDAEYFTVAYDLKSVSAGQDVEARYKGTQMWYGAKLEKIHKDNTVDIQYEDMDVEKNVSLERIRLGGYHPDRRQNVGTRRSLKDRLEMHADELQVTYLLNMLIRKSMLPSTSSYPNYPHTNSRPKTTTRYDHTFRLCLVRSSV